MCLDSCSQHGTCIDGSCVCDELWSGRSDFINYEGWSCDNFIPLNISLWAIVLAANILLQYRIFCAASIQLPKFWRRKRAAARQHKKLHYRSNPFVQLGIIAQISPLTMMVVAVKKLAQSDDSLIGSGIVVSICFLISSLAGFIGNMWAEVLSFDALFRGEELAGKSKSKNQIRWKMILTTGGSVLIYFVLTSVSLIAGIAYAPENTNPNNSFVAISIPMKNFGVQLYMFINLAESIATSKRIKAFQKELQQTQSSQGSSVQIELFLDRLSTIVLEKKKTALITFILYSIFSLPWLWPYQTVLVSVAITKIFSSKLHFIFQFMVPDSTTVKTSRVSAFSSLPAISLVKVLGQQSEEIPTKTDLSSQSSNYGDQATAAALPSRLSDAPRFSTLDRSTRSAYWLSEHNSGKSHITIHDSILSAKFNVLHGNLQSSRDDINCIPGQFLSDASMKSNSFFDTAEIMPNNEEHDPIDAISEQHSKSASVGTSSQLKIHKDADKTHGLLHAKARSLRFFNRFEPNVPQLLRGMTDTAISSKASSVPTLDDE